jgi:hypothetical protein
MPALIDELTSSDAVARLSVAAGVELARHLLRYSVVCEATLCLVLEAERAFTILGS